MEVAVLVLEAIGFRSGRLVNQVRRQGSVLIQEEEDATRRCAPDLRKLLLSTQELSY